MKAQIVLKKDHFERLRDDTRTYDLVNSFYAEKISDRGYQFKHWSERDNTTITTCVDKSYVESVTIEDEHICGNCRKTRVQQPGWICSVCKHSEKFKAQTEPDYDSQMMQNFVLASKLLEELPKDQRARVAKALGILHGN